MNGAATFGLMVLSKIHREQTEIERMKLELTDAERATLAGLRDGTLVAVPRKLLTEAHACMRACGWQLAPADDDLSDGVLALAVADIERRVSAMLAAAPEAPGRGDNP